jgi:hypothetical protein
MRVGLTEWLDAFKTDHFHSIHIHRYTSRYHDNHGSSHSHTHLLVFDMAGSPYPFGYFDFLKEKKT